jgi:hypothetical protein
MKTETSTTPFNTGRYAQPETSEKIDKYSNRSQMKHSGGLNDPLRKALGYHPPLLPSDEHTWSHSKTSQSRGAHYNPAQQFGAMSRTGAGRGVYGYGGNKRSAPSANAVPGRQNSRNGGNAVGSPPNRRGTNAVPGHENRNGGTNAIGSAPNRFGESALASKWTPKFKGGPASRRA